MISNSQGIYIEIQKLIDNVKTLLEKKLSNLSNLAKNILNLYLIISILLKLIILRT